jgi:hypothetical protein
MKLTFEGKVRDHHGWYFQQKDGRSIAMEVEPAKGKLSKSARASLDFQSDLGLRGTEDHPTTKPTLWKHFPLRCAVRQTQRASQHRFPSRRNGIGLATDESFFLRQPLLHRPPDQLKMTKVALADLADMGAPMPAHFRPPGNGIERAKIVRVALGKHMATGQPLDQLMKRMVDGGLLDRREEWGPWQSYAWQNVVDDSKVGDG